MMVRYYYLYNNLSFSCTFTPSAERIKKTKAFIAPDLAAIFVFLPPGRLGWTRVHRNHERKLEGENARRQGGYTTLPFFSFILFLSFFSFSFFLFVCINPRIHVAQRLRRSGRVHNVWVTRKPVISSRTAAFLLWHRSGGVSIIQRGNSARRTSTTAIAAATAVSVYHHLHHHHRAATPRPHAPRCYPPFPLSFRYAACWPIRSQVEREPPLATSSPFFHPSGPQPERSSRAPDKISSELRNRTCQTTPIPASNVQATQQQQPISIPSTVAHPSATRPRQYRPCVRLSLTTDSLSLSLPSLSLSFALS